MQFACRSFHLRYSREFFLRASIPTRNDAVQGLANDDVVGRLHDGGKLGGFLLHTFLRGDFGGDNNDAPV